MSQHFIRTVLAVSMFWSFPASSGDRTLEFATLEWPPFTGAELQGGGLTTTIVRQAVSGMGADLEVHIHPWKRAIARAAARANEIVAYFPEYHCRHSGGSVSSETVGQSPLGFAERVDRPIAWRRIPDLPAWRIGVGLGYANTEEFDKAVSDGDQMVITSHDDTANLKKLSNLEVDAAVVDLNVFRYLMTTRSDLTPYRGELRFDEKLLRDQTLYVCFTDTPDGRVMRDRFNASISSLDLDALARRYLSGAGWGQ